VRNYNKGLIAYFLQLGLVLLLGVYFLVMGEWHVQSNLLSLLPGSENNLVLNKAEQALFKDKEQQVVIALHGKQAIPAYQTMQKQLSALPMVELNEFQLPSLTEISQFYLPYKDNFLSDRYLKSINDPAVITQLITSQLIQMNNPFVSSTIGFAPRLNLADYLNTELNLFNNVEIVKDIPSVLVENDRYFISQLSLKIAGFSLKDSQQVNHQLLSIIQQVETTYSVDITYSGVVFHTAYASEQAEFEISSFGVLSLIGVIILILSVFRSLKPLLLSTITLSIAVLYGLTGIVIFFEKLHLLTLVFAVTLIGIVIDYCFHRFVCDENADSNPDINLSHQKSCADKPSSHKTVSNYYVKPSIINKPLLLGFLTTVLGYFGLFYSPLALLSQVAVFMIFGLLGGLLTVTMLLPHVKWLSDIRVMPWALAFAKKVQHFSLLFVQKRKTIYSGLLVVTIGSLLLAPLNFNDDVRLLNSSPQLLLENEAKMANILNYQNNQRIVVTANTIERLLQRQEEAISQLQQQPALIIKSIAGLLPSQQKQQAQYQMIKSASKQGVFNQGLANIGLVDTVDEFKALTYQDFTTSQLNSLATLYITQFSTYETDEVKSSADNFTLWLDVSGNKLNADNLLWLIQQSDMRIFDKAGQVSSSLTTYRQNLFYLLATAFVLVFLVLLVKYGVKQGVMGLLPIGLSAIISLSLSQYFLGQLNIFNLLALLLILALAIDYVIFYQEHGLAPRTCLAIMLSAISSALVFGMLAFSSTPAVQSFGLTVMFGIIAIFILAPLSSRRHHSDVKTVIPHSNN
jgi:predicted exporter